MKNHDNKEGVISPKENSPPQPDLEESSSPGEFHPQSLTDPELTASRHPALIILAVLSDPALILGSSDHWLTEH